jgi:shikimate dehydrogenase
MTGWVGVIGSPIAHSLSPPMHNAGFAALGLDWSYGAFEVPPDRLAEAIAGAAALGFRGLNVTIPHKEAALALAVPDEEARRVGALNTLVFEPGGGPPRGLNTDLHGFRALLDELRFDPVGARAAVLGAGGAARAVVAALSDGGAEVSVVTRSARRRIELPGRNLPHLPWRPDVLAGLLPALDLLVDATPRGLAAADDAGLDLARLRRGATVVDLVVRRETPLVAAARARGLAASTGAPMLLHQGARSFEAWTGLPAPIEAMRGALEEALARGSY